MVQMVYYIFLFSNIVSSFEIFIGYSPKDVRLA